MVANLLWTIFSHGLIHISYSSKYFRQQGCCVLIGLTQMCSGLSFFNAFWQQSDCMEQRKKTFAITDNTFDQLVVSSVLWIG